MNYYDGKIYVLADGRVPDLVSKDAIYELEIDGSNRKQVYLGDGSINTACIHQGNMILYESKYIEGKKNPTVSITKSYQRLNGRDLITTPKTEKSNRVIRMPKFLVQEIQDYLKMLYGIGPEDRMFQVTKSYLYREMKRGSKEAGVKCIRVHDIRHSAVSLLIDMGFSATAIADRVGHESIEITYNYAHMFPSRQAEMADKLDVERGIENVSKKL